MDVTKTGGRLDLETLRTEVEAGRIDTVLIAMTDMQGRLQGKRLTATHFLDEVVEHDAEGCNYLLAVDVEMNTVEGYTMSSWERGYGDFVFKPDMDTLRTRTLAGGDGARNVRPRLGGRLAGRGLAPAGPQAPAGAALRARPRSLRGNGAGVPRLYGHLRGGVAQGVQGPGTGQLLQRGLLAARDGAHRAAACGAYATRWRRRGSRSRMRRASATSASTRSTSSSTARSQPQTATPSTRTGPRRSPPRKGARSPLCPSSTNARATPATSTSALRGEDGSAVFPEGHGFSETFEHFIAGQVACLREFMLFFAPNINSYKRYAKGSFAPTAVAWGKDNRTC